MVRLAKTQNGHTLTYKLEIAGGNSMAEEKSDRTFDQKAQLQTDGLSEEADQKLTRAYDLEDSAAVGDDEKKEGAELRGESESESSD
jgi:hypothetical protein